MENFSLGSLLEIIGELFSDEISIAVSTKETYIYYRPSKRIDLKIMDGDLVKKESLAYQAMDSGQKMSEFIPRDVFGVPYHGMAVPVFQNGQLEGCVTAIYPAFTDSKSVITVRTEEGWVPTSFSDVKYVKVKDRKTYIITDQTIGTHKNTLHDFEYILPRDSFIRCHRSFIVNVHHIRHIYPDSHSTFMLEMNDDTKIPVSQSYASYFRRLLGF